MEKSSSEVKEHDSNYNFLDLDSPAEGGQAVEISPVQISEDDIVQKEVVVQITDSKKLTKKQELELILQAEKTHAQWKKQGINIGILFLLLFVNLWRGSKSTPSLFGVDHCSAADWTSVGIFGLVCIAITVYTTRTEQHEQSLKRNHGTGLDEVGIDLRGSTLVQLMFFSFFGGWVSGALGLGGGSIFNPLLLSMGLPPKVASATGLYMLIFSTAASTISYIIADMLDISYGLWVGGFCIVGTIGGMYLLNKLMTKLNR